MPGGWAGVGARRQGAGGSYVPGAWATHLWVAMVSLGQERQGFPGRQLQARPRSHLRGNHLMAPDGSKVLPAVATTQLHWVDRWPSDQDGRVGRPEEQDRGTALDATVTPPGHKRLLRTHNVLHSLFPTVCGHDERVTAYKSRRALTRRWMPAP